MDFNKLKYRFLTAGVVEQLIYINVGMYLLTFLLGIFKSTFIYSWFSLWVPLEIFIHKPWGILTYGFVHSSFVHLFGNLLGLYYFGHLFLDYFGRKQVLVFYILGTITGGVLFILGFYLFPALYANFSWLVGSSAGVSALIVGIATHMPDFQMRFALIGSLKLKHIAWIWIGYSLLLITANTNVGGNLAHIGGALFAFIYVQQLSNRDISLFSKVRDFFKSKKKPLKTVYRSGNTKSNSSKATSNFNQEKIDVILDKIGKSGYESLTKEEKDFLFLQGKKN